MSADLISEIESLALSEDKIVILNKSWKKKIFKLIFLIKVTYKLISQTLDIAPLEAKK